jgi:predicted metalloprotease
MDIEGREESTNVEDRRGPRGRTGLAVGGIGGIIVVVLGLVFGWDPSRLFNKDAPPDGRANDPSGAGNLGADTASRGDTPRSTDPEEEKMAHFAKVVFHDTEVVWTDLFAKRDQRYTKPVLVLFSGEVQSACGEADAAVGPFYCGGDSKVYIDLSFYSDMERKLNAPGDFARAYVIAHEVGHHVQRLLGYSKRAAAGEKIIGVHDRHEMSVRLELQADYLAGVWAHHGQKKFHFLQQGDIESALNAAFQIGDDRLQKKARGYVVPDSFTHGTSKQRQYWFKKGLETGDVDGAEELFTRPYDRL